MERIAFETESHDPLLPLPGKPGRGGKQRLRFASRRSITAISSGLISGKVFVKACKLPSGGIIIEKQLSLMSDLYIGLENIPCCQNLILFDRFGRFRRGSSAT